MIIIQITNRARPLKVFKNIEDAAKSFSKFSGTKVCIGNFDGCHIGHQNLIKRFVCEAKKSNQPSVILTFDPNPKVFFEPGQKDFSLFSSEQKLRAFAEQNVDFVVIQSFDSSFREMDPIDFTKSLAEDLKCRSLYVGSNFRFGKNRSGTIDTLSNYSESMSVKSQDVMSSRGSTVSSTRVRQCLLQGDIELANSLLGRPYCLKGTVRTGKKLGRTIGFPTANLHEIDQLVPKAGVYCGYLSLEDPEHELNFDKDNHKKAIFNIGTAPTVGSNLPLSVEGHAFNCSWDNDYLYGKKCRFYLLSKIRDEMKFPSLDDLKDQIENDCKEAKKRLS